MNYPIRSTSSRMLFSIARTTNSMPFNSYRLPLCSILLILTMSPNRRIFWAFIILLRKEAIRMILRPCIYGEEGAIQTICCLLIRAIIRDTASTRSGLLSRTSLLRIYGYSNRPATTEYLPIYSGKRSACVQHSSVAINANESIHSRHHSSATYAKHQSLYWLSPQKILQDTRINFKLLHQVQLFRYPKIHGEASALFRSQIRYKNVGALHAITESLHLQAGLFTDLFIFIQSQHWQRQQSQHPPH